MSDQFYGVNFHWGLGATTVTVTGATGIYHGLNYSTPTQKLETPDQRGKFIAVQYYNGVEKLTLEWLASDASAVSGSAVLTFPSVGTSCTVTSVDTQITGTGWKCDNIDVRETNTSNTVISGQFTRYAGF
jgi:hypothetical protein